MKRGTILGESVMQSTNWAGAVLLASKDMRNLVMSALLIVAPSAAAYANVVTDWDATAMEVIQGNAPAPPPQIGPIGGLRIATIMHIAIFQAVNTIEPRYEPYQGQVLPRVSASLEAAATAAASTVLMKLLPADVAAKVAQAREAYLAAIQNGEAKMLGVKLGDQVAIRLIESRTDDGNDTVDAFRPETRPGVYTETMPVYGWKFATMRPFAMTSPSQFRPLRRSRLPARTGRATTTKWSRLAGRTARNARHGRRRTPTSG